MIGILQICEPGPSIITVCVLVKELFNDVVTTKEVEIDDERSMRYLKIS